MDKKSEGTKSSEEKQEETKETKVKKERETEKEGEKVLSKKEKLKKDLAKSPKEELVQKIIDLEDSKQELKNITEELTEKVNDWKDKYMRLQAEFENSQKRWDKARKTIRNQTKANVLSNFLPLYDSFHSAVKDMNSDSPITPFFKQFMNILKSYGAEPLEIEEGDRFNYDKHEALSSVEKEELPNNTIIDVIQDGWKLNKDILRYAKVIISRKPKPPPKPKEEEEQKEEKEQETENEENKKKEQEKEQENNQKQD
jgi:molecular chaperone GrpE